MLKSKKVLAPEVHIEKANAGVRAQQEQFHNVIVEVDKAIETRTAAMNELEKEVNSLEAIPKRKRAAIDNANDQNAVDRAFKQRIMELVGQV